MFEPGPDADGFGLKSSLRNQYPGDYTGQVFLMRLDQLISGSHQEGSKIPNLGCTETNRVTFYQAVFAGFPGTEGCFPGEEKLLVPDVAASIKVYRASQDRIIRGSVKVGLVSCP